MPSFTQNAIEIRLDNPNPNPGSFLATGSCPIPHCPLPLVSFRYSGAGPSWLVFAVSLIVGDMTMIGNALTQCSF